MMKLATAQTLAAAVAAVVALVGLPVGVAVVALAQEAPTNPPAATRPTTAAAPGVAGQARPTGAGELYLRAAEAIAVESPASTNMQYPESGPFGPEWQRVARQAFEAGGAARRLARQARAVDAVTWPAGDPSKLNNSYLNAYRNLANNLGDAALYQHLDGDDAGAFETLRDVLHLAAVVRDRSSGEPGFLHKLTAGGIEALVLSRIETITSGVTLIDAPAEPPPPPPVAASDERPHPSPLAVADARRLVTDLLEARPSPEAVLTELYGPDYRATLDRESKAAGFESSVDRGIETFHRIDAERGLAAMSLAAHLFRHDKGRWPASLKEMVPDDLPRVPLDPWGDGTQTLGYEVIPGGLPDGSDRPVVFSRATSDGGDLAPPPTPQYGFYNHGDDLAGQYRDVARWPG